MTSAEIEAEARRRLQEQEDRIKELEARLAESESLDEIVARHLTAEKRLAEVKTILHRPVSTPLENAFKINDALRAAEGKP